MTDLLDELKAKVEAAAKGTWHVGETQTAHVVFANRGDIGQFGQTGQSPFARANADLAATAANLARRLTSEEGVKQAVQGARALRFRLINADEGEEGYDMTGLEIDVLTFLTALNALLSDSQQ